MTFDHDFGYSFLLFSFQNKEGREKENEVAKIVIKSYSILLDPRKNVTYQRLPSLSIAPESVTYRDTEYLENKFIYFSNIFRVVVVDAQTFLIPNFSYDGSESSFGY